MNKRWLLNLVLLALVAVLGLLAYLRPGIEKPAAALPISRIDTQQVSRIEIQRTKKKTVVLEKKEGKWLMVEPIRARANEFNVSAVLQVAAARSQQMLPADSVEVLAKFGLEHPRARLRLNDKEILFGSINPVNNLQYVLHANRLHMISNTHLWPVVRPYFEFLATRLIEEGRNPVSIQLPGLRLVLKKGEWKLRPPHKDIITDRVNQFVYEWRYANALTVKRYAGKPVQGRIRFTFAANGAQKPAVLTLGILARAPELILYRRDEGLQYHFPKNTGRRLLQISSK